MSWNAVGLTGRIVFTLTRRGGRKNFARGGTGWNKKFLHGTGEENFSRGGMGGNMFCIFPPRGPMPPVDHPWEGEMLFSCKNLFLKKFV